MDNKTNEARLNCLYHFGDMTYICREEECWSLSNVGYGPRTRQVVLAHKPLLLTVIFFAVFLTEGGGFGAGECAAVIDAAIEFDSCYIQGEPQSIWWAPGQSYIKGILVNPQHSTVQEPSLCFPLPDRCPSHCFVEPTFQRENLILLAASVTSAPTKPTSLVIQSHLSSFQECTSVTLSYSPSLVSLGRGALGSLGAVCVWLSQIFSSSVVKWDTVTSSLSTGLHPGLLSGKCQRSRTRKGRGSNSSTPRHLPIGYHRGIIVN